MKNLVSVATILILSASTVQLTSCTNISSQKKLVSSVKVTPQKPGGNQKPSVNPNLPIQEPVNVKVTIKKDILNQPFFYGADLQYSSEYDKDYDLYTQSLAIGHIPAYFRIHGDELQLVADDRRLFPSDVNHPETLISRFKIYSQTKDTLEISGADSSVHLSQWFEGGFNPKAPLPKDSWIRSFDYVADGNYLLQETSVMMADGSVGEFMESIFPQTTIQPSKAFEKFLMDPEDKVGGSEGAVARYRFLKGETIFDGEDKIAYAQHFDIVSPVTEKPTTIDWYVTPNIKDEHLEVVRAAVEGWNRYFKSFKGIEREVVKFKGRLPKNIKLGDPRFNVINWDSRLVAGAAYESQANDPFTGKQSHSLIYMPVAWFQIGMDYWKNGQYSEGKTETAAPGKFKRGCYRDLHGIASELASYRMSPVDTEKFSIQLMKQTLFHEVGHAMGLGHNFKGSLSFNRADPKSMFSTSIMDYNDYEIERAAFYNEHTEDGPLLEYDRQAMSAIYNKAADVKNEDAVVPTCNDDEADMSEGAVDPLCIRYDTENDPSLSVVTALNRINQDKVAMDSSLSDSIRTYANTLATVLDEKTLKETDSAGKQKALEAKVASGLTGVLNFYYLTGKASVSRAVRNNVKTLKIFADDVLPASYSEKEMRERAFSGIKAVFEMKGLSEPVKAAILEAKSTAVSLLLKTAYTTSLQADAVTDVQNRIQGSFDKLANKYEGVGTLQSRVYATLNRDPNLPYFFGKVADVSMDFETALAGILFEVVTDTSASKGARQAAAGSLASYKGRVAASDLLSKAQAKVSEELKLATDNEARETLEDLLGALSGS